MGFLWGFNSINFYKNNFKVNKIKLSQKQLNNISKNMLLIYTGINKFSHNVEKDKISKLNNNIQYLNSIYDLAKDFKYEILNSKNYDFIGNILDEYWSIKKNYQKSFKLQNR